MNVFLIITWFVLAAFFMIFSMYSLVIINKTRKNILKIIMLSLMLLCCGTSVLFFLELRADYSIAYRLGMTNETATINRINNQTILPECVAKMEPQFLQGISIIRFANSEDLDVKISKLMMMSFSSIGTYLSDFSQASVYTSTYTSEFFDYYFVFSHEIGHHVWFQLIEQEDRDAWTQVYDTKTCFITPYAKTSAKEDFAENFAFFITENTAQMSETDYALLADILIKRGLLGEELRPASTTPHP